MFHKKYYQSKIKNFKFYTFLRNKLFRITHKKQQVEIKEIIDTINEKIIHLPEAEQKTVLKFAKRLDSYIYIPHQKKEKLRMKPFSEDAFLVDFLLDILNEYDYYPKPHAHNYNNGKPYWYILFLLMLSNKPNATDFVIQMAENFLKEKHIDLYRFRQAFRQLNLPQFKTIQNDVECYFLSIQDTLEAYQWAKEIGLQLPSDDNWRITFDIGTSNSDLTNNKEKTFSVMVTVMPLEQGRTWEIRLSNRDNSVSAWYPNLSENKIVVRKQDKDYFLNNKPSLRNLKKVMTEIEEVFDVKFSKTLLHSYFQGKIRNKNTVQKWLNEE